MRNNYEPFYENDISTENQVSPKRNPRFVIGFDQDLFCHLDDSAFKTGIQTTLMLRENTAGLVLIFQWYIKNNKPTNT